MRRGLVAAVVAGLCLAGAAPAGAVFPGENGRIAYSTETDESTHTILPSGNGDRVIGDLGSLGHWSPNGRRMAFSKAYVSDIYTMLADGAGVRRLTFDGGNSSPSYSPGGGRIAFNSEAGIATMKTDGSNRQVIARGTCCVTAWGPNTKIAFTQPGADSQPASLWAMRPNGTHRHRLVFLGRRSGYGPLYSPDGNEFLFVRNGLTLLADANGDNVRKPPCSEFFAQAEPQTYSPDGRWVLGADPLFFDPRDAYPYALARVNLASCQWRRVVSPAWPAADWQAVNP